MPSEAAPQEAKSQFEQTIVETVDTGYVGEVTKQLGKEKVTLSEFAQSLGDRAPSAQIIDELNLLEKNPSELGIFARTSNPSELANGTIFLGTKFVDKDEKVWFKTFIPGNEGSKGYYSYTQSTAESKFYGLAIPTEEAVDFRQE